MRNVYDVVETTNGYIYRPMGMYLTLEDAISGIESACNPKYRMTSHADDYEKIEVRERKIGMSSDWKTVYTLERVSEYNEETDSTIWRKKWKKN
jgi:hypothetical protein